MQFVKWITSPARAAQWGIDTGYVAVRPDAWDTPALKKYVADFPAAVVARDQLQYAVAGAVDARQPARHQGAQRRSAGRADRQQDTRRRRWPTPSAKQTGCCGHTEGSVNSAGCRPARGGLVLNPN